MSLDFPSLLIWCLTTFGKPDHIIAATLPLSGNKSANGRPWMYDVGGKIRKMACWDFLDDRHVALKIILTDLPGLKSNTLVL